MEPRRAKAQQNYSRLSSASSALRSTCISKNVCSCGAAYSTSCKPAVQCEERAATVAAAAAAMIPLRHASALATNKDIVATAVVTQALRAHCCHAAKTVCSRHSTRVSGCCASSDSTVDTALRLLLLSVSNTCDYVSLKTLWSSFTDATAVWHCNMQTEVSEQSYSELYKCWYSKHAARSYHCLRSARLLDDTVATAADTGAVSKQITLPYCCCTARTVCSTLNLFAAAAAICGVASRTLNSGRQLQCSQHGVYSADLSAHATAACSTVLHSRQRSVLNNCCRYPSYFAKLHTTVIRCMFEAAGHQQALRLQTVRSDYQRTTCRQSPD
eukprot:10573-Heterococcus_DN1.PRE.3